MNNSIDQAAGGVSDGFFPLLTGISTESACPRKLSLLAEMSFLGGRGGDCRHDWRCDLDEALAAFPRLTGARRDQVLSRLDDAFFHGSEAHWPDFAHPSEAARMLARGLAIGSLPRTRAASDAGDQSSVDWEIAVAAGKVAEQLAVEPADAARAALDAFGEFRLRGSKYVATEVMREARAGWERRGGDDATQREIAYLAASAKAEEGAEEASVAAVVALIERLPLSVEEAIKHGMAALAALGLTGSEEAIERAMEAAQAAKVARGRRLRGEFDEVQPYPNAEPPLWWREMIGDDGADVFDLEREPALLGDIARWSVQYAFRPVPEFAPLIALATLAPVFSRRFATPTNAGLNLYLIGLAETGGGKEAVIGAPQALLSAAKLDFLIGAGDFTSDSAIELALRARPNFLAPIDEVSEFIGAAQHRNAAAHARTLRKAMLELYSKSRSDARWSGKQKVEVDNPDKAANPIYAPHLSILGCATVSGFFEALTEGNLTGGFVNRWIVVRGGKPGSFNADPARLSVPDELRRALTAAYADTTEGNLSDGAARDPFRKPTMRIVPWGDSGEETWHEVLITQTNAVDSGRSDVVGRAAENCLKVATIRALARDGLQAAVTGDDVLWAWDIVRSSIITVETGARENMAGSEFELLVKTMGRYIVEAGPNGLAMSDLIKKRGIGKHTDPVVDAALKRLEQLGVIYKPAPATGPKGGRPGVRVRARQFSEG